MDGVSVDSGAGSAKSPDPSKSSSNGQDAVKKHNKENGTSNGPTNNHHSSSNHSSSKHHSSSSKHHSSSSKHHSSSGDKKHHSSSSKHSSSSGEHKKHSSSSSSEKKHSSSSSGDKKHSSSSSGDKKHHSSSSSGDKKHHSSSSGDKKHHSSSSGDKKHHSSSKHKDGKEHSSSKHREHKHDKDGKHSSSEIKHEKVKTEQEVKVEPEEHKFEVKPEPVTPVKQPKPEPMEDSEDDMPLIARAPKLESPPPKRELSEDEDDDVPLAARAQKDKKVKVEAKPKPKPKAKKRKGDDDEDDVPKKKKAKPAPAATAKKGKKKEEPEEKWRWWEEERKDDGTKWKFLEHNGPVFAPEYEPLPDNIKFYYDGKHMRLTPDTEEVATFYGRMIDHDYTTMDVFNKNFFKDWRSVMTHEEKEKIKDLKKCNFKEIDLHFKRKSEERKAMSKDERNKIKEENARLVEEYGFCTMDSHKEKIGNFRIEPPGLFRGRGSHPKMGHLKRRVLSKDIIINCSKDSEIPKPPEGQRWKEVRHDNTVTWLASWQENVQGGTKYIMLNPASRLKGEKDWSKYETARKLHKTVDKIRATYREDWKSKEMRIRQRAVALYFIDKLALRAGNEKDEETADTVGCCSLRVEHVRLHEEMDGKEYVVEFDFLGKDSIRYYNKVAVEKRVFKNLQLFTDNKAGGDDLFDRLNTAIMNKHLQSLMDGLTAKVFRTYNASRTLQEQLDLLTEADDAVPAKMLSYNRANRAVAVLCNHQRAVPKNFSKQMENIQGKIDAKKDAIHTAKKDLKAAKSDFKNRKTDAAKTLLDRKKKAVDRLEDQLTKLEVSMTDKDENKDIALGTSKLNYLDPRISCAWCKKWEVPIEKIYNKTQRDKFAWAMDMAEEDFVF